MSENSFPHRKRYTYVMNVVIPLSVVHPFVIIRGIHTGESLSNVVSVGGLQSGASLIQHERIHIGEKQM